MQTMPKQLNSTENTAPLHGDFFWPAMAVFYTLFVVRDALSVQFPIVLYLACVALMAFIFNDTEIKALIISFIPLASGFQSKNAVLICMIVLLLKYGKRLKVPLFIFTIPLLMFWELLHLGGPYSSIAEYLSSFAPLMCLAIIVSLRENKESPDFFARVLAVSLVVGCVILLINTAKEQGQSLLDLIQQGFRFGNTEEADGYKISYNANGLGFLCNLSIVGLLINVYFKQAKKIDYAALIFLIVIGCLTVSRTFLLCLVGTVILYLLVQKKTLHQKIKSFFAILTVVLLFFVAVKLLLPNIIENYIIRFNADDVTGGRSYLYDFYNDFIISSTDRFWFGIGMQGIREKVLGFEGIEVNVPHNGYQQMIVAWGVIGLVCMLSFIICLVLHAKKKNPRAPLICYMPLVLLLTNIIGGQFITAGSKLLSLLFIYLMIRNGCDGSANKRDDEKSHNQKDVPRSAD